MVSCAVAPDGRTFVAGDERGRVHLLRLMEPEDAEKEAESMTEHVFLSYCRDNDAAVRQLYDELTAAGHAVWRDQERLLPGMDWKHEIRRAIRRAYAVVICFSARSRGPAPIRDLPGSPAGHRGIPPARRRAAST